MNHRTAIHLGLAAIVVMTAASGTAQDAPVTPEPIVSIMAQDGPAEYFVNEYGIAITDGDIALGPANDIARTPEEARKKTPIGIDGGMIYQTQRWPNGRIPYVYAAGANQLSSGARTAIDTAISRWNTFSYFTKVTFVPRSTEAEYVVLGNYGSNWATLGWQAGRINTCSLTSTLWQVGMHELGHTIGLPHEHQRSDRDLYWAVDESRFCGTQPCRDSGVKIGNPLVERFNMDSIMEYNQGELNGIVGNGAFTHRGGEQVPLAKSQLNAPVWSDLRTIASIYTSSSNGMSVASMMHGKCLDAQYGGNGVSLVMWDCVPNSPEQTFTYAWDTGLIRVFNNYCLSAPGAQPLTRIQLAQCNANDQAQQWRFADGYGQIVLRTPKNGSGEPLCMDIAHQYRHNGAELLLQRCHRADNQYFKREPVNSGLSGGVATRINSDLMPAGVGSAPQPWRCIDAENSTGAAVMSRACDANRGTRQQIRRTAAQEMRIHNLCVDIDSSGRAVLRSCNGGSTQRWNASPERGEIVNGSNGRCLDVTGASTGDVQLQIIGCNGHRAQGWQIRPY